VKRFLTFFIPPALLSLIVWFLLVGSIVFSEGYSDCKQFGIHDPSLCADYDISLGGGVTIIFTGAAFLTATLLYFSRLAWLKDQKHIQTKLN